LKFIFLAGVFFFANSAWAKPALVKSGEHSGFSRLVLYTDDVQKWSQTRSSGTVTVTVQGWSSGFDTSRVFEMIPTDRITQLESTTSSLMLKLGCDCTVEVQTIDQGGLMIDVMDARKSVVLAPTVAQAYQWPDPDEITRKNRKSSSIAAFRKSISERVARAATQQILTAIPINGPDRAVAPDQLTPRPPPDAPVDRIRTTSASERAARREQSPTPQVLACPPKQIGDIENWGSTLPFSEQFGEIRNSLIGEFDTLDQSEALRLTRLYLYFAMGAEALATIDAFGQTGYEIQFLRPLAKLLDGASPDKITVQIPTNGCNGTNAIWGVLLATNKEEITEPHAKIIAQSFSQLPYHLRSILGPRLITRLKNDGNEIAASVIRNSIANRQDESTEETPNPEDLRSLSAAKLKELIGKNNSLTPQALVVLLEGNIEQGASVSDSMREIARSFVVQQRGDQISVELETALVKDAALRGAYLEALQMAFNSADQTDVSTTISFVAKKLIDAGSDIDVAKFVLRLGHDLGAKHLQLDTISAISERLKSARLGELATTFSGLPSEVDAYANVRASTGSNSTLRNPRSRQALEFEQPTLGTAKAILESSRGAREQIMSMLGDQ
jgi:hypothetical protein